MVKEALQELTGKKNVYLVSSGLNAIIQTLDRCYEASPDSFKMFNKLIIPDQGGRLIFKDNKADYEIVELKTTFGVLWLTKLREVVDETSIVLLSSLAGYFAEQPMREIEEICRIKGALLINDVSGSIGRKLAQYGDIIVGSFGKFRPINLGYGGFIASDEKLNIKENFDITKLLDLKDKLDVLNDRATKIYTKAIEIKNDLKDFEILHRESNSLVVVVRYNDEDEKNKILKYCEDKNLKYKLCPKYTRVKEKAISIEVKQC
ncbi:MAG: DegT/DnrJ/EryC1/StrS family aminotransferase [Candidatus Nanoarchaeia archaeon]|nr:DegT/DnrJ/EryC1/StrS family aminotransferase [Candidatus Nanoarchaeia archaeon]